MQRYDSPYGTVELTDERLNHIIIYHPEVRRHIKYIPKILSRPEVIRRSKFDPNVFIFYGRVPRKKWLASVVKLNNRNFILTAYITNKIQHQAI